MVADAQALPAEARREAWSRLWRALLAADDQLGEDEAPAPADGDPTPAADRPTAEPAA